MYGSEPWDMVLFRYPSLAFNHQSFNSNLPEISRLRKLETKLFQEVTLVNYIPLHKMILQVKTILQTLLSPATFLLKPQDRTGFINCCIAAIISIFVLMLFLLRKFGQRNCQKYLPG